MGDVSRCREACHLEGFRSLHGMDDMCPTQKKLLSQRSRCWRRCALPIMNLPRFAFGALLLPSVLSAADWPQWRFDAGRSAATEEQLPEKLALAWERGYGAREQVWDDPLNHDLMSYDRVFEPVVLGNKMFLGFNDRDKVVALDIYKSREKDSLGLDTAVVLQTMNHPSAVHIPDLDDAAKYILDRVRPHDVVLTLGAGDSNKVAQQVLAGIQLWSDA